MPTGYTVALIEDDINTKKWVTEHLARAFGICVMLRDEGRELTEDEIKERLKQEINKTKYHRAQIKMAEDNLKKYEDYTDKDWKKELKEVNDKKRKRNKEMVAESERVKKIFDKTKKDLLKLFHSADSEITKNIAKFGIEQIEKSYEYDAEPYTEDINDNWEYYKEQKLAKQNWNIKHHTKEMNESIEREKQRYEAYINLIKEVNECLSK